jgi:phosphopantetheinyl transferase
LSRLLHLRAGPRGDVRLLLAPDTARASRALASWLHPADRAAARAIGHRGRRRAFLVGRALLRRLVADQDRVPASRTRLRLQRARRPLHRAAHRRRLALSLTHTAGWILAAAAPGASAGRRLGVDLETRGRALTPGVRRRLAGLGATAASPTLRDWCLAEAALKADGRGIAALSKLSFEAGSRALLVRSALRDRHPGSLVAMPLRLPRRHLVGAIAVAPRLGPIGRERRQDPRR